VTNWANHPYLRVPARGLAGVAYLSTNKVYGSTVRSCVTVAAHAAAMCHSGSSRCGHVSQWQLTMRPCVAVAAHNAVMCGSSGLASYHHSGGLKSSHTSQYGGF
jgi:hypothetical protein